MEEQKQEMQYRAPEEPAEPSAPPLEEEQDVAAETVYRVVYSGMCDTPMLYPGDIPNSIGDEQQEAYQPPGEPDPPQMPTHLLAIFNIDTNSQEFSEEVISANYSGCQNYLFFKPCNERHHMHEEGQMDLIMSHCYELGSRARRDGLPGSLRIVRSERQPPRDPQADLITRSMRALALHDGTAPRGEFVTYRLRGDATFSTVPTMPGTSGRRREVAIPVQPSFPPVFTSIYHSSRRRPPLGVWPQRHPSQPQPIPHLSQPPPHLSQPPPHLSQPQPQSSSQPFIQQRQEVHDQPQPSERTLTKKRRSKKK